MIKFLIDIFENRLLVITLEVGTLFINKLVKCESYNLRLEDIYFAARDHSGGWKTLITLAVVTFTFAKIEGIFQFGIGAKNCC